jgi:hypothetical protein
MSGVITSYSTLVTAVSDYLARSDLSTFAPLFVQNFEQRFFRQPKNFARWMEADFTGTIASSVLAVPSDYLDLKTAYVNGNPSSRLEIVSLEMLYGTYPRGSSTGIPFWISRDRTNFVFGPAPDSNYTIKGVYWAKPTPLRSYTTGGADAVAHYLIVNASDLCLYGALCEAESFLKNDSRVSLWKGLYNEALDDYRDLNTEEEAGNVGFEVLA